MPAPEAPAVGGSDLLAGLRVLVTRPEPRAHRLCAELRRRGAVPVAAPAIELVAPQDPRAARNALAGLDRFDLGVFVSPSAVEWALVLLAPEHPLPRRIAAMGPGTGAALERSGIETSLRSGPPFDSEALLRCPALAAERIGGMRIAVLKGEGGRDCLAGGLRRRGARVEEIDVYRRRRPPGLALRLRDSLPCDAVVLTSAEAAGNLLDAAGREGGLGLAAAHFVVISERVAETLRGLGVREAPTVARQASDRGLVEAIEAWAAGRR